MLLYSCCKDFFVVCSCVSVWAPLFTVMVLFNLLSSWSWDWTLFLIKSQLKQNFGAFVKYVTLDDTDLSHFLKIQTNLLKSLTYETDTSMYLIYAMVKFQKKILNALCNRSITSSKCGSRSTSVLVPKAIAFFWN